MILGRFHDQRTCGHQVTPACVARNLVVASEEQLKVLVQVSRLGSSVLLVIVLVQPLTLSAAMSYQSKPTANGVYRIKVLTLDLVVESTPGVHPGMKLGTPSPSNNKQKVSTQCCSAFTASSS